jgi:hypothetical protein
LTIAKILIYQKNWKQRILKFDGKIDDVNQNVIIENEEFNDAYDYEPDEQSKELKKTLWCNDIETYENISVTEFCRKYGKDNVYRKYDITF